MGIGDGSFPTAANETVNFDLWESKRRSEIAGPLCSIFSGYQVAAYTVTMMRSVRDADL